jgi:hypothetical protein
LELELELDFELDLDPDLDPEQRFNTFVPKLLIVFLYRLYKLDRFDESDELEEQDFLIPLSIVKIDLLDELLTNLCSGLHKLLELLDDLFLQLELMLLQHELSQHVDNNFQNIFIICINLKNKYINKSLKKLQRKITILSISISNLVKNSKIRINIDGSHVELFVHFELDDLFFVQDELDELDDDFVFEDDE